MMKRMESRVVLMLMAVSCCYCLCSAAVAMAASAPAPAPAPQQDCSAEITKLVPCLGFVEGMDMNPSKNCCQGLTSIVQNSPACLCQLISSGAGATYGINTTLALQLPSKCNLTNVDPSRCTALLPGAPAPAPAPTHGHHHHHKGAPFISPSLQNSGPVPAPTAGAPIPGGSSTGTFGFNAPKSSPSPAHSLAARFSPIVWMYLMTLAAVCTFF